MRTIPMMRCAMPDGEVEHSDRRLAPGRIVLIADDLTGACDSGVAFLRGGRRARVILSRDGHGRASPGAEAAFPSEALVFTTDTRDLPREQAERRVSEYVSAIGPISEQELLFKKVDSAGRGNFAAEIRAALDGSGAALALVAPAFPELGRTMQAGVLSVRDCSGASAETVLADLFAHGDACAVAHLPEGPSPELEDGIGHAIALGTRVLLCDATTRAGLERLAIAGLQMGRRVLWAGSAGLAHALAAALSARAPASCPVSPRQGRAVLFAGSLHPATDLQLQHLTNDRAGVGRAVHRVPPAAASRLEVIEAFSAARAAALVLTGGDTAAFVLRALGASSIALGGEVSPGLPWGIIEGGTADGCMVVTKSGGFGNRRALIDAFEFCEGRSCGPS